jgi:RNA polymerase sigma-70 factor (ECF subfamily)
MEQLNTHVNAQNVLQYRSFLNDSTALEGMRARRGERSITPRNRKNNGMQATSNCPAAENTETPRQIPPDLEDMDLMVRTHRGSILRYAMSRLGDRDLAETVAQDCLMRAFRARADFRGAATVRTWLFTIATNLIRDYTRTKRFRFWREAESTAIALSEIHDRVSSGQPSPESNLLVKEQLFRMRSVIDSLPTRQREVLLLRYAEEMKITEIAISTGMTMSAIKTHLYRGVRTIRTRLQEYSCAQTRSTDRVAPNLIDTEASQLEERYEGCL